MAGLEPSQTPEQGPSLLDVYARAKQKRQLRALALGGGALLVLGAATLYEFGTRGTSYLLAIESAVLAAILAIAVLLALSGAIFCLSWNFAQAALDRGETRPRLGYVLAMVGFSVGAGIPFAAVMAAQKDWGQAVLGFVTVFWVTASCSVFAYLARFAASGKRLL